MALPEKPEKKASTVVDESESSDDSKNDEGSDSEASDSSKS